MKYRAATKWSRNPALVAWLLLAFCARALVPVGFMPGPGGLVVCDGPVRAPGASTAQAMGHDMSSMDMAGMDMSAMDMSAMDPLHHAEHAPNGGASPDHRSSLCPFAAAATSLAGNPPAALAAVVHTVTLRIDSPPQAAIPRDTVVPTRLPRGPPLHA